MNFCLLHVNTIQRTIFKIIQKKKNKETQVIVNSIINFKKKKSNCVGIINST